MKKAMFALSALTFILAGCDTADTAATQAESQPTVDTLPTAVSNAVSTVTDTVSGAVAETVEAGHNAFNSLDWQGTYKGTLPCADCAGIDYTLTLSEDETYTLTQVYQGKEEDGGQFTSSGKFHWDTKGSVITLEDGSETPNQYFVGENLLMKLDINGEKITGDMATLYNLKKQ